jgi:hypothetical protein
MQSAVRVEGGLHDYTLVKCGPNCKLTARFQIVHSLLADLPSRVWHPICGIVNNGHHVSLGLDCMSAGSEDSQIPMTSTY